MNEYFGFDFLHSTRDFSFRGLPLCTFQCVKGTDHTNKHTNDILFYGFTFHSFNISRIFFFPSFFVHFFEFMQQTHYWWKRFDKSLDFNCLIKMKVAVSVILILFYNIWMKNIFPLNQNIILQTSKWTKGHNKHIWLLFCKHRH